MVKLLARSPSVETPNDFTLEIELHTSIAELKRTIESQHQSKPSAREMRIIWNGRILKDKDTVQKIYSGGDYNEVHTVHFVLNTPMNVPVVPRKRDTQQETDSVKSHAGHAESIQSTAPAFSAAATAVNKGKGIAIAECAREDSVAADKRYNEQDNEDPFASPKPTSLTQLPPKPPVSGSNSNRASEQPHITPLGNRFQYVLVNGMPYLMELKPLSTHNRSHEQLHNHQVAQALNQISPFFESTTDRLRRITELLALQTTRSDAYNQQANHTANPPQPLRQNQNQSQNPAQTQTQVHNEHAANPNENMIPLREMIRNINFNAVWNFAWLLLRMALLVAVFAHDASIGRLLLLSALALGVVLLRNHRGQGIFGRARANNNANDRTDGDSNNEPRGDGYNEHRIFSVWDKVKALAVALVTSIVPAEPFQAPFAEE